VFLQLLKELSESGLTEHQIWSSWHGDSHLIANDQVNRFDDFWLLLQIRYIFVRIRIRRSMPLTNGAGPCYFRH
jgi:hypothetical protein